MIIGIPKECKAQESRVSRIPGSVMELVKRGHLVLIERGAGEGASYSDWQYVVQGVDIAACPVPVKCVRN